MTVLRDSQFKSQVRVEAGLGTVKVPNDVADSIADIFVQRGQTTFDHIGTALAVARHVTGWVGQSNKKETRTARAELVLGLTTPEAVLSRRQREEAVRPYVEQLRRDYFGAVAVPFLSYKKALGWMYQKAVVDRSPTRMQGLRLQYYLDKVPQRFPRDWDFQYSFSPYSISLLTPNHGPPGPVAKEYVRFNKGSALENLKKITESMSNGTGCDVALCVAHVLTGTPLLLRPLHWRIEVNGGCGLFRRWARIDILQPHAITLPVLIQAYRVLRKELGLANTKTMAGWHERLLRLVEKRGGVPRRGKTEFWEDIQRTWNKAVPRGGHRYETWMGPKMAYDRLQRALKKR